MADLVESLSQVPLFAGIDRRKLGSLAGQMAQRSFAEGEIATEEGKGGTAFWIIESGEASVAVKGRIVRTLGPGDYFGEISLIDGKPRSATVTAKGDLTTISLVSWDFTPLLDKEPEVSKALLMVMCARVRAAESR
jgi:CRP/FNR family transcriptional regulator, cyclic AMP receptor protein